MDKKHPARNVLITGGSGMIGHHLSLLLIRKGYQVTHLSRKKTPEGTFRTIHWDPACGRLDANSLKGFEAIVHLAGTGVADKKWTERRKSEIINSRIDSAGLLRHKLAELDERPQVIISASATGFYGSVTSERVFKETDPPGDDFLGRCCKLWEKEIVAFDELGMRSCVIRTGVVLSDSGGALSKMVPPIRYFLGAALGSGKQYIPWIHLQDLCNIYLYCLENKLAGIFNGVSPNPVTNGELTKALATKLKRPLWLPKVPAWILKVLLGEMSTMVLDGSRVSADELTSGSASRWHARSSPIPVC